MSLFRRAGPERHVWGDSLADVIELQRGPVNASGVPVDDEHAMRLSAVFGCVDLLSELVSTLPVAEYRRAPTGNAVELDRPPILDDPAGDGTGFEVWSRQVMTSLLLRGNAYGLVLQLGSDGWPIQVESLHPDRVEARRQRNFGPIDWRLDNNPILLWPEGPLWHLPAYVVPGNRIGMSPVRYAAETIGLGLATRRFGAQFFRDNALPTQQFTTDLEITEAQAKVIKSRIIETMRDNRQPLVLGAGGKLEAIQVSPDESQFLETMQANVAEVCRYFRVPPEAIGAKAADNLTYANQEQRNIALLTNTLNGWLVRVEKALTRLRPRPRYVKFNADALLRVDLLARYKSYDLGIRDGWLSRDEVRELEDLAPLPADEAGGEHLWPPYSVTEVSEPEADVVAVSGNGAAARSSNGVT